MEGEDFIVGSVFREAGGWGGWTDCRKMYGSYGVLLGLGDGKRDYWTGVE